MICTTKHADIHLRPVRIVFSPVAPDCPVGSTRPIGKQKLAETKKDTGTVNFPLEGVMVKAQVSKTVKWNQEGLAGLCERIRSAGDNPSEYMKIAYDVSETKFKEWPDTIKNAFSPFRTVVPGKPRFDYAIIEDGVPATDTPPWQ